MAKVMSVLMIVFRGVSDQFAVGAAWLPEFRDFTLRQKFAGFRGATERETPDREMIGELAATKKRFSRISGK